MNSSFDKEQPLMPIGPSLEFLRAHPAHAIGMGFGSGLSRIAPGTAGTLWAWTAVTSAPPGYQGDVPYGLGVVELPEGIRVITRLTESDPAALSSGQAMELRIVPLHTDADGNDVVTFAFSPVASS